MSTEQEDRYFHRGLTSDQIQQIASRLPDVLGFRDAALDYSASVIAMKCHPGSGRESLPDVGVCLQDASLTLWEARYGLEQALVSLEFWKDAAGHEQTRIAHAQYYAADVAHRVYATGEHLAAAVMRLLAIPESALEKKKQTSRQSKLLSHLKRSLSTHPITIAISALGDSQSFLRTLNYRADWVHDQPPRVAGLGITYKRNAQRWKEHKNAVGKVIGRRIGIGGGDPATISVESVVEDGIAAVRAVTTAAQSVMDAYDAALATCGIRVDHTEQKLRTNLF